jgi:5-methyltetrahydropteroyltriglutamate--homocysteine methyltransferase
MSKLPTHAHVVGSAVLSDELLAARKARAEGKMTPTEFKAIEDKAVDEVIAQQEEAGLTLISDGELRRIVFVDPLTMAIEGIGPADHIQPWRGPDGSVVERHLPFAVTDKVRKVRSATTEEYTYARARSSVEVKAMIPSPSVISAVYSKKHSAGAYPNFWDLVRDCQEVLKEEVKELVALGATQIQIDAPELTFEADPVTKKMYDEMLGISTEQMLTEGMDLINDLADVPGVTFSLHICRGNAADAWMAYGAYDSVAERVFERAGNIDTFLLEYTSPEVGSYEMLSKAPDDKEVVLGLLSSKDSKLESADELKTQIEEAAKYFPLEQLSLSSQCGFSNNANSLAQQKAKFKQVADVAESVWG